MIQTDAQRKKSQRERTAKHRAKLKDKSANDLAAKEQRRKDEFDLWRVDERLVFPGECEAFRDADTCPDALTVAREFLAALSQPDVQAGETLLDVERRVMTAWCAVGAPLLNRNTLRFDTETACSDSYAFDFDKNWIPLSGSNELIDLAILPLIEAPAVAEVSATEIPAPAIVEDATAKQFATEVARRAQLQQETINMECRRISAKNLQRELETQKRLGI
jgi:hypothetical protein